ncbi:MAG TPA: hypothetical protein VJ827_00695, partial [Rubrobacter sp.]|nr:hypothetical protein [Rubrobacter sp.]
TDYPEPPSEMTEEAGEEDFPSEGGAVKDGAAAEEKERKPGPEDRSDRLAAGEDPGKGDEPTRVQDPQAGDAPGVVEESGKKKQPAPPEGGRGDTAGTADGEKT